MGRRSSKALTQPMEHPICFGKPPAPVGLSLTSLQTAGLELRQIWKGALSMFNDRRCCSQRNISIWNDLLTCIQSAFSSVPSLGPEDFLESFSSRGLTLNG